MSSPEPTRLTRRVDRVEEDLQAIGDTALDIKDTVDRHTVVLAEHSVVLAEHSVVLAEHSVVLAEHSVVLAEHGVMLEEILRRLEPRSG